MIQPREAWQRLDPLLRPLPTESVPRREALGRVLAAPIPATVDVPAADVSAMDGYALPADSEGPTFQIAGTIAAGDAPGFVLPPGQAARIMTGAPLPTGADRVVPVEETDGGGETVEVHRRPELGRHIRRQGEIVRGGEPILDAGTIVTPGTLGLLATHGIASPAVHGTPRVAILTTGDEVVPADTVPGPGQLRDSHTDFLLAACASLGLRAETLGIAPDEPTELTRRIRAGLDFDVLLLCGGVSMGEFDLVEGSLGSLGCEALFDSVAMQPGKPLVVARHGDRPGAGGGLVFGLPGNPASVMVAFWLFVRPALRRLMGLEDSYWHGHLEATLEADLPGAKGRDRFLAGSVRPVDGALRVRPRPPRGSHDLGAYGEGACLVRIPAHAAPAQAGDTCEILPLADWRTVAWRPDES